MKKILVFLSLLISSSYLSFAQSGFNYKAIVKDDIGNVVSNDLIVIEFTIFEDDGVTAEYREQHTPNTNNSGLINVNIGEGIASLGSFLDLDWSESNKFLGVRINIGEGFENLGTTQFKLVPYAMHANTASSTTNSAWETTDENIYRDAGNIGIGTSEPSYPFQIAAGDDVVFGSNLDTTGSKFFFDSSLGVLRSGRTTSAIIVPDSLGLYSFAAGYEPVADGSYAAALNFQTHAKGNLSFASGLRTYSDTYAQATFGRYNVRNISSGSATAWSSNDPVFVVGNGTTNFTRNNAFTILKDGRVGINDATPEYLFDLENDDLSTRGIYLDHNATTASAGSQYGVFVDMDKTYATENSTFAYAGYFDSRNDGGYAYGIYAFGTSISSGIGSAYGVRAVANNDNGTGSVYGIYASLFTSTSTGAEYAGYFSGDVYTTGSYLPSDENLKNDVRLTNDSALAKLVDLPVENYTYKNEVYKDMRLPRGLRTGFTAQNVEKVMPELVQTATQPAPTKEEVELGAQPMDELQFKAVDYTGMVPYLVKAIQELKEENDLLNSRIIALENGKSN